MSDFEIEIASIPNKEKVVAEIFYKNEQWVEISQETDELIIRFYSPEKGDYWEFNFEQANQVLREAKQRLLKK